VLKKSKLCQKNDKKLSKIVKKLPNLFHFFFQKSRQKVVKKFVQFSNRSDVKICRSKAKGLMPQAKERRPKVETSRKKEKEEEETRTE
jgi:hypothetical protein